MNIQHGRQTGATSELLVAYRFLAASRIPSWPLMPMPYDLLVDTADSIQRVQVKTAHQIMAKDGAWRVRLTKRRAKGDRPMYTANVDYVVMVCEPNLVYVVPATALASPYNAAQLSAQVEFYTNSGRFAAYKNAFAIGRGFDGTNQLEAVVLRESFYPAQQVATAFSRKRHVRLNAAQINEIRHAIGTDPTPQQLKDTAAAYHITSATLRNLLKGNRKDLHGIA